MPKISNDWFGAANSGQKSRQKNNNMSTADVFVRPKVGEEVTGRIVGEYASFVQHWPRRDEGEKNEKGEIAWKNVPFPDAEERKFKPTRICCDDTPAKERMRDIEAYVKKTKCGFCRLKFQGYHGNIRHAFNLLIHNGDAKPFCRILELPPTAMSELGKICAKYEKAMPEGPGTVTGKAFEFTFARPQENKWTVSRWEDPDATDKTIGDYLVYLTDADKAALKVINADAETEEDLLKGHDLNRWYRKDYLSIESQKKLKLYGTGLDVSPYEKSQGASETVEDFENESDDAELPEINEPAEAEEDQWGSLGNGDADEEATSSDEEETPLW